MNIHQNFFTKEIFLFNFLTFILILHYNPKPVDAQCSMVYNKIFQNDKVDERDENEGDGDEIPEFCENGEGFATGATFT